MKSQTMYSLLYTILVCLSAYYCPWWCTLLCAIAFGLLSTTSALKSIGISFVLASAAWFLAIQLSGDYQPFISKISEIFQNIGVSKLIYITIFIGGLTGSIGTWVGCAVINWIRSFSE